MRNVQSRCKVGKPPGAKLPFPGASFVRHSYVGAYIRRNFDNYLECAVFFMIVSSYVIYVKHTCRKPTVSWNWLPFRQTLCGESISRWGQRFLGVVQKKSAPGGNCLNPVVFCTIGMELTRLWPWAWCQNHVVALPHLPGNQQVQGCHNWVAAALMTGHCCLEAGWATASFVVQSASVSIINTRQCWETTNTKVAVGHMYIAAWW